MIVLILWIRYLKLFVNLYIRKKIWLNFIFIVFCLNILDGKYYIIDVLKG